MNLDNMTSVELYEWAEKICGVQKLRAENKQLRRALDQIAATALDNEAVIIAMRALKIEQISGKEDR